MKASKPGASRLSSAALTPDGWLKHLHSELDAITAYGHNKRRINGEVYKYHSPIRDLPMYKPAA